MYICLHVQLKATILNSQGKHKIVKKIEISSKWLTGKSRGNGFEFEIMGMEFELNEFELAGSDCR